MVAAIPISLELSETTECFQDMTVKRTVTLVIIAWGGRRGCRDEGGEEQEPSSDSASAQQDLDEVKSSLVNESENQSSSSDSEVERRPQPTRDAFQKPRDYFAEVRRPQDGAFFKGPPYPGYPFLMIPDLSSPYLSNGPLSPGGARTDWGRDCVFYRWTSFSEASRIFNKILGTKMVPGTVLGTGEEGKRKKNTGFTLQQPSKTGGQRTSSWVLDEKGDYMYEQKTGKQ
ncbi:PREDICTED: uncharacterized protein LOC103594543 [Galeopterus variegatus]|uniref:Uncharacterized protein LOC103594543 n=1 Tax=Galeopterus variegatus TaxID=482537 RepID=A0ABM0R5V0_GALVR|nr:PREDICTED: uncharacterized protein LOC103594543 [Galeopterus variegatus]